MFLKGDSNPKLLNCFCSVLLYQRKFSPPHPSYQIFKNFQSPCLLSFEEFTNPPPFYSSLSPSPSPLLLDTQEYVPTYIEKEWSCHLSNICLNVDELSHGGMGGRGGEGFLCG